MASKIGKFVQSLKDSVMGIPGKKKKFQKDAKDAKAAKSAKRQQNFNKDVGGPAGSYMTGTANQKARLNAAFN